MLAVEMVCGVPSPELYQNYPNPFNSSTFISFTLPQRGAEQQVSLEVYDVQGRLIIRLVDEPLPGGHYSVCWRGTNGGGRGVASGIYFVRLKAGMHVMTKPLGLIR